MTTHEYAELWRVKHAMTQLTKEQQSQQRGLTLISALINFVDWLDSEGLLKSMPERERAQLVLRFFDAHSRGQNYFMQAEQIMEILGQPFDPLEPKKQK